jgi:hypothetical protein
MQTGTSLGERDGCVIVELTDDAYVDLLEVLAEPNGGVRLAEDGALTVLDPPEPPEPEPSEAAGLVAMAETIDYGGNTAIEELSLILQAFASVAQQRGW